MNDFEPLSTKRSLVTRLGHNLLETLPLNKNGIEVRLKLYSEVSEFVFNDVCFGYADIIKLEYVIRGRCIESNNTVNACVMTTPQQLHRRMGYLNWNSVLQLPNHAKGIQPHGKKPEEVCGSCMKGHQRQTVGHAPMSRGQKPLQFIHSDLAGPYPTTRDGYRYYITFLDDRTGVIWLYLL